MPQAKFKIDNLSDPQVKETFPLLLRACDGNKVQFSTIVTQQDLAALFGKFREVCKHGMQGLKQKRDQKKERSKKREN